MRKGAHVLALQACSIKANKCFQKHTIFCHSGRSPDYIAGPFVMTLEVQCSWYLEPIIPEFVLWS